MRHPSILRGWHGPHLEDSTAPIYAKALDHAHFGSEIRRDQTCILVHQDYCAVWLLNKALCIRRRFSNEVAYLLERGRAGVSVRARISRCKIKKNLAHPTRFERVTFAFGGQRSTLRAALDRHNLLGIEPVVDP